MKKIVTIITLGTLMPLCASVGVLLPPSAGGLCFGVTVTPVIVEGLTSDIKTGLEVGILAKYDLGNGHGLGANISFSKNDIKRGDVNIVNTLQSSYSNSKRMLTTAVGVNYTYHIQQSNIGTYLLAGTDIQRIAFQGKQKSSVSDEHKAKSTNALGCTIGIGHDFKNVNLELAYKAHAHQKPIKIKNGIKASLKFKF